MRDATITKQIGVSGSVHKKSNGPLG